MKSTQLTYLNIKLSKVEKKSDWKQWAMWLQPGALSCTIFGPNWPLAVIGGPLSVLSGALNFEPINFVLFLCDPRDSGAVVCWQRICSTRLGVQVASDSSATLQLASFKYQSGFVFAVWLFFFDFRLYFFLFKRCVCVWMCRMCVLTT